MAVLPGDFPPRSVLRRADIVCLRPWSHPFQEFGHNHRLLICNNCHWLLCGQAKEPKCTWYNFFGIKTHDVSGEVKCFTKMHYPATTTLAYSEILSPNFVEYLVRIKVALILRPNFAVFCDTGQASIQWFIHSVSKHWVRFASLVLRWNGIMTAVSFLAQHVLCPNTGSNTLF